MQDLGSMHDHGPSDFTGSHVSLGLNIQLDRLKNNASGQHSMLITASPI